MIAQNDIKRGYRNGWILTILAVFFILFMLFGIFFLHHPEKPPTWDMDNEEFVPASSDHADDYHIEPDHDYGTQTRNDK